MSEITTPQAPHEAHVLGRGRQLIGPAAALAFGMTVLLLAQGIAEPAISTSFSPRWWPQILGSLICVLALGVAIKGLIRPETRGEEADATRKGMVQVALVLATVLAYGVLWYFVDFRIATLVLIAGLVFILGGRGWKALLLFPVITTGVLYVVFGMLLRVPL